VPLPIYTALLTSLHTDTSADTKSLFLVPSQQPLSYTQLVRRFYFGRRLTEIQNCTALACGLTFLALLVSLSVCRRGSWGASRMAPLLVLAFGSLAGLIATIVFFVDIGLVRSVGSAINDATDGDLQLRWGNAV
jgi:hypothetical protein